MKIVSETEGQTAAVFSGMDLGSFHCKIMKAEFDFCGAIAALYTIRWPAARLQCN